MQSKPANRIWTTIVLHGEGTRVRKRCALVPYVHRKQFSHGGARRGGAGVARHGRAGSGDKVDLDWKKGNILSGQNTKI